MSQPLAVKTSSHRLVTLAHWFSIVCMALSAALFALTVIPVPRFLPIVLAGGAAGVVGLVMSVRARHRGFPRKQGRNALLFSIGGILVNALFVIVVVLFVSLSAPKTNKVELRGQGYTPLLAQYSDDFESYSQEWPANGRATFNSSRSGVQITLRPRPGELQFPVSCQILWNGKLVSERTSNAGEVTCRFESR